jgi:hypothetical protein
MKFYSHTEFGVVLDNLIKANETSTSYRNLSRIVDGIIKEIIKKKIK